MAVVRLDKTLRAPGANTLSQTIQALLRCGEQLVVLDLERLETIDAAGIGELIAAFGTAHDAGAVLRITRPGRRVGRLLRVAGVFGLLDGSGGVELAVAPRVERRPRTTCAAGVHGLLSCA